MSEQKKKNTIILVTCMIICVILTSLLCTNTLECSNCDGKISGKYYLSISENPYCKECGEEYYRGWPGDLDNVSDKVDNTLRNILLIIEILGFATAIVAINKGKSKDVKKIVPTSKPISGTASVPSPSPVPKPTPSPTPKTASGGTGRLKTTIPTGKSESSPISDDDRFKPAGDL